MPIAGAGQSIWDSRGASTNEYITKVMTEKNMAHEYRYRSAFGKLSKPMGQMTVGSGPEQRSEDVGVSAAIWSKEITTGDEVRFTLQQRMKGSPTFGDAEVRTGSYLAYLHQNIYLNQIDTPAIPLPGAMSNQRVRETIANPESNIRAEIPMYLAEQYSIDAIEAYLRGSSMNLMAPKNIGGRAIDIGLGAGVQVSPENFIVAGSGVVSGTSGTTAYETNLAAALDGLNSATTTHRISRGMIHELRAQVSQFKIGGIDVGGVEKWYCPIDPILLSRLTAVGGDLYLAWRDAAQRGDKNPVFGHGALEVQDFIFFPEPWLQTFRPDKTQATAGVVQWGPSLTYDRRELTSSSTIMLCMVLGSGALLEGHNGSVSITSEVGKHEKGMEISGHIKQSFMRSRWLPKDGRTDTVLNQSSMCVAFAEPGLTFNI